MPIKWAVGCGIFVIIGVLIITGGFAMAMGSFHFGETGHVSGFLTVGKDGCLLQDKGCIWQYAVEIQQVKEKKLLIYDREDQIPPVKVGGTIEFTGPTGDKPNTIYVWASKVFTPNTNEIPDVWTPPTPVVPPYSP